MPVPSNQIKLHLLLFYASIWYICDFFLFHIEIEGKCGWIIGEGGGGWGGQRVCWPPFSNYWGGLPPPCPPPPPSSYAYDKRILPIWTIAAASREPTESTIDTTQENILYSRTSMARTSLGPSKLVRDRGSSSQ